MKVLGIFDHAFAISLTRRQDRRALLAFECDRVGIEVEVLDALEPSDGAGGLNAGKHGCKLSHCMAVAIAKSRSYSNVLLLEDDVVFCPDFAERFPRYREILEQRPWSVFNFGVYPSCPPWKLEPGLLKLTGSWLGHCYALSSNVYDDYLERMDAHPEQPHDLVLGNLAHDHIVLAPNPYLAWQRDGLSDLTGKFERWSEKRPGPKPASLPPPTSPATDPVRLATGVKAPSS